MANTARFHLGCQETNYLEYVLGNGEIRPHIDKVKALVESPVPKTNRQLKSFLGLVCY